MIDTDKTLVRLIEATQDLFILHALQAGAKGQDVRKHLKVNQWRVTNISKLLKASKTSDK